MQLLSTTLLLLTGTAAAQDIVSDPPGGPPDPLLPTGGMSSNISTPVNIPTITSDDGTQTTETSTDGAVPTGMAQLGILAPAVGVAAALLI